jgi:hypothetical protein
MDLLDHLIDKLKVFPEAAQSHVRIGLELGSQIIEIDVHSLVRQSNFVHHPKEAKKYGQTELRRELIGGLTPYKFSGFPQL